MPEFLNQLSFLVEEIDQGAIAVTPIIDGQALPDLVEDFETAAGYTDPAGGYGGIVPSSFDFGPLEFYFRGENSSCHEDGKIAVLGCECGVLGCWPLHCRVSIDRDVVTWRDFAQPHREKRTYAAFGPFRFDRQEYEDALASLPRP